MSFTIRRCTLDDLDAYARHSFTVSNEKGLNGIIVQPFSGEEFSESDLKEKIARRWSKEPFTEGWGVYWVALVENKIVGHIDLKSPNLKSALHRMMLGMAIEQNYRSKGLGTALLKTALNWAKEQKNICWIDLGVFEDNIVAYSLYKKFGFIERGRQDDAFRVDGYVINDIQMSLRLR